MLRHLSGIRLRTEHMAFPERGRYKPGWEPIIQTHCTGDGFGLETSIYFCRRGFGEFTKI